MADPDSDEQRLRLALSLRLKAARFMAGGMSDNGRAVAMSVAQLADHPVIRQNGITKNRLEDCEQLDVTLRPMELEQIADALGVPRAFLLEPLQDGSMDHRRHTTVEELLDELRTVTRKAEEVLAQLGRDAGRRDLQSRAARDRFPRFPSAAA